MKPTETIANPLTAMGLTDGAGATPGGICAVLARAGVGKTAFLVQLSLSALTQGQNVLHVSLVDPIRKINLGYKAAFQHLMQALSPEISESLWMKLLPHRFIMSIRESGFSIPALEERMADLTEQEIFRPEFILVDGLPVGDSPRHLLTDLKSLATRGELPTWVSVRTHREDPTDDDGIPTTLSDVTDLFDVIIHLIPEGSQIQVKPVKWPPETAPLKSLHLDPATMLVKI